MNGRFLLDTSIIIALLAQDTAVRSELTEIIRVFVPSIVLGELYYGAYKSSRVEANLAQIDALTAQMSVIGCDALTAQRYGRTKNLLRAKGRPIPENDIWIAAIAQQHQLTLVTRDEHFKEIDDLLLQRW